MESSYNSHDIESIPPSPSPSPPPPPPPPPPPAWTQRPYETLFSEPSAEFPEPLPCPNVVNTEGIVIRELMSRCVVRVGELYAAKFGSEVTPAEGQNMMFVRRTTNIPVPRVFAIYQQHTPHGRAITYIIMEYIHGQTLESLWPGLTRTQKSEICAQLRSLWTSLRSLPGEGYFGGQGEAKKLTDGMFQPMDSSPALAGPFHTEAAFINAIVYNYASYNGERLKHKAEYYRRTLPKVLQGFENPIFTHNDLQRKNIIITPDEGKAVVIDWADAGWYPVYWEYTSATFANGGWFDDWHEYIAEILDEYPNQYAWLDMMRHEMWG